jgi:[methyl-Co(III) methanol-specific corrinoid protein]:coenzyme M methyltransferase
VGFVAYGGYQLWKLRRKILERSKRDKILRLLDGERTGQKFCSCHLTSVTWAQMDAVSVGWPEAHLDAELHVRLAETMYTILGFEGVRSGFDVGLEAEAFGAETNMGGRDSNVYVTKPAFDDPDSFAVPSNLFELGRFPVHFKALAMLSKKYREEIPIYAMLLGPLTLMGHLFGVEKIMRWALKDATLFESILERVSDVVTEYGNFLLEKRADALSLADPTASGNLISPRIFKKFIVPNYRKLSEKIRGRVILHICGDTTPFLDAVCDSGFCAFSFEGPAVKVKKAKEIIGDRMALFGNIPAIDILMNGSPNDVRKAVIEAIEDGIDSVEPACGLPLQTPIRNAQAISKTVQEFNTDKGLG